MWTVRSADLCKAVADPEIWNRWGGRIGGGVWGKGYAPSPENF